MLKFLNRNLAIGGCLFLLLFTSIAPVHAQAASNSTTITLLQLGQVESYIMRGPYDDDRVVFGLPSDWQLVEGGSIQLFFSVVFNNSSVTSSTDASTPQPSQNGGTLSILFNDAVVGVVQLDKAGEQSITVNIPADALKSRRADQFMDFQLELDSGDSCDFSKNTMLIIYGSSNITLFHNAKLPDTSLVNFPYTIYHDSFIPDTAVIVIPDKPTNAELEGVFSVVAGLGNLTNASFQLSMATVSSLTAEQKASNHIIFIGNVSSLPILSQLEAPVPLADGKFNLPGIAVDDGIVQMVNSPWSPSHVVLIVSGNTDAGIVKAAQAVSTGILRPSHAPNISVVELVNEEPVPASIPVDTTLADLGYENRELQSRSTQTFSYEFYVPPGKSVTSEAFFELAYGHSNLLNYQRTGIVVQLNGTPVSSIRMSDETAANPVNLVKIGLPTILIHSGINRLDLRASLEPKDICAPLDMRGEWVTVWSQSRLHLPLSDSQVISDMMIDLSNYPAPFVNDPTLKQTAFILDRNDTTVWQSALGVVRYLGDVVGGVVSAPKVFFADDVTPEDLAKYNLIIFGYPSKMKIIQEINLLLPAPFDVGDIATEKNMQVIFRIPSDTPIGYIETLPSPWNENNVVLAVLGNTPQGLAWAAAPLGASPLRSRLQGNYASIVDQQILTADTRLAPSAVSIISPVNTIEDNTPVSPVTSPNSWIPVVLGVAVVLLLVTLAVIFYLGKLRSRSRVKVKYSGEDDQNNKLSSN